MLVAWNGAEEIARSILRWQCQSPNVDVLISEMNNVTMRDAILAIAKVEARADLGEHLDHFASIFDLVREYRNYYAHGIRGVFPADSLIEAFPVLKAWLKHSGETNTCVGMVYHAISRAKLAQDFDVVSVSNLKAVEHWSFCVSGYGTALEIAFKTGGSTKAARKEWPSWPEKPTLPPKLEKNRAVAARRQRQLRSSPPST